MFLAAVVQLHSSADKATNLATAESLIRQAASRGARLVATPEDTNFLGSSRDKIRAAETLDGPTCRHFSALAKELNIYLLLGSFNERSGREDRVYNTSVFFGSAGEQLAVYRKIHLFDAELPGGIRFQESDSVLSGDQLTVCETVLGRLGMSVCFDLRFGELYRRLVEQGAELLSVPSAFTLANGRDHWEPLLRARAIECQCYVLAPGQWGRHDEAGARESYGHSMIVDPWGHVIAMVPDGLGVALAEIDLSRIAHVRRVLPLVHRLPS